MESTRREEVRTNPLITFRQVFYESSFGVVMVPNPVKSGMSQVLGRFFVDNTTWTSKLWNQHPEIGSTLIIYPFTTAFLYKPILNEFLSGGSGAVNSSQVAALTLDKPGTYDIVINNLDNGSEKILNILLNISQMGYSFSDEPSCAFSSIQLTMSIICVSSVSCGPVFTSSH